MIIIHLKSPKETGKVIDSSHGLIPYNEQVYNHSFIRIDDDTFTPLPCLTLKPLNLLLTNSHNLSLMKIHSKLSLIKEESLSGKTIYQHYYLERKNYDIENVVYPLNSIDSKFYTFFCLYHYTDDDKILMEYFDEDDVVMFSKAVKIYNPSVHTLKNGVIYDNNGEVIHSIL